MLSSAANAAVRPESATIVFVAPFDEAFVRTTPFGVLAALHLPGVGSPASAELLHADEQVLAAAIPPRRRAEWIGGRLAFWRAAAELGVPRGALGTGPRGEPMLPEGLAGSISHKSALAVALVAHANGASVGVDLETLSPPRPAIEDIALRSDERDALRAIPEAERWPRLVLAFAVKEALYKALHPRLQRFVRYDEAAVVFEGGVPGIVLHLDGGTRVVTEVRVEPIDGYALSCVRVTIPERT